MNKLILTISMAMVGGAYAQTTIKIDNFVKTGERVVQYDDQFNIRAKLSGGSNVTWDFSSLNKKDSTIIDFYNPDWKPTVSSKNPNCNLLANSILDSNYILLKTSATGVDLIGFYDYSVNGGQYQDYYLTYISFPLTMGSALSSVPYTSVTKAPLGIDPDGPTGPLPTIDSFSVNIVTTTKSNGIGWGSVKLPSGTLPNCIMAENVTIQENKDFKILSGGVWAPAPAAILQIIGLSSSSDTSISHNWFSSEPGYGFVVASYDIENDSFDYMSFVDAKIAPSSGVKNIVKRGVKIYPNPVNEILNIEGIDNASFSILNINGQIIAEGKMNANTINTSSLEKGVYTLRIHMGNELLTQLFLKE